MKENILIILETLFDKKFLHTNILPRAQNNGGQLWSVAPFCEESKREGLDENPWYEREDHRERVTKMRAFFGFKKSFCG